MGSKNALLIAPQYPLTKTDYFLPIKSRLMGVNLGKDNLKCSILKP